MIIASIALVLTLALISLGMPVGFAAGIASLAAAAWFFGDLSTRASPRWSRAPPSTRWSDFLLLAILFLPVCRALMNTGGITERLVRLRRGAGAAGTRRARARQRARQRAFAGMSGSATADAVGLGRIEIKAMEAAGGYDHRSAPAITAASALTEPDHPAEHRARRLCGAGAGVESARCFSPPSCPDC